jgi:hypothetical protein
MKMHVEISCCGWHFQSFDGIRSIPSLSLTTKFAEILFKLRLVVIFGEFLSCLVFVETNRFQNQE